MRLSWELLRGLERIYGDSFYLLDLKVFEENYDDFLRAFRSHYRKTNIAYSYKTNYIPKLCQCVDAWGGYAEVVSRMEYELALRVGVAPERIIFNGPYKRERDMEEALLSGSIVNLDSPYEVALVEKIGERPSGRTLRVGIRFNFDIGVGEISRFGFDVESEEFKSVLETLTAMENCNVLGLHCHYLPPRRSVPSYTLIAEKMLKLATTYFRDHPPQFIDLGGGFLSRMSPDLQRQFPFAVPSYQEYADGIAPLFADAFPRENGPELILEPGIALTADIMKFVARVIDKKTLRGRKVALVSGSIYNIKPTKSKKNLPVQVLTGNAKPTPQTLDGAQDLVGYTCMEDDCLYRGYRGPISVGDYVVFDNVGAYTLVLKPPFIQPCPPVLAYDPSLEEFEPVKHQEEFSDVFSTYTF